MCRKYCFIALILLFLNYNFKSYYCEKATLISVKEPVVTFYNKRYIKYFRFISRRYSRADRQYYSSVYFESLDTIDNSFQVEIYLYEFRDYIYRRTYIEVRLKMCDYVEQPFFGASLKKALQNRKCPFPPGKYEVENITLSSVPFAMPFRQGRFYGNLTRIKGGSQTLLLSMHVDVILQDIKVNPK